MKKIVLYSLLLFCIRSTAQISIRNNTLLRPDSNVLFLDIENRLTISAAISTKLILVSEKNNRISNLPDNEFLIVPLKLGPDILKVYTGNKLLFQKKYIVDTLSAFQIQLGNLNRDTATVGEILANRGLLCVNKNKLFRTLFRVFTFKISGIDYKKDTLFQKKTVNGNIISQEQERAIRTLTKNCKLVFEDIGVTGPRMKNRTLDPITVVIR